MDDSKCLVCEFKNEGGNVAVGYQEWLNSSFTTEDLNEIIEREIEVKTKWPSCDVGPNNVMKKRLTKDCQWETFVITIHAYGKWAQMCEVLKNLEKYGVAYTSRSDRRVLKKKSISTDEDDEEIARKPLKAKGVTKSKNQSTPKKSQTKKELSNIQSSQQKDLMKRYFKQKTDLSRDATDSDPEDASSDQNGNCTATAKMELLSKMESLIKENKNLKEENTRLRALQFTTEYLPKIEKESKKVLDYLQKAITLATEMVQKASLNDNIPQTQVIEIIDDSMTRHDDDLPRDNEPNQQILAKDFNAEYIRHITQKHRVPTVNSKQRKKNVTLSSSPYIKDEVTSNASSETNRSSSPVISISSKGFDYEPPFTNDLSNNSSGTLPKRTLEIKNANANRNVEPPKRPLKPNCCEKTILKDKNVDRNGNLPSADASVKPKAEKNSSSPTSGLKVDIGKKGILYVSAKNLAKCNYTSAMKLTGDLLSLVFSKEELASSSLTGTVANLHLNKSIQAKKQLDPQKVDCIKCYVREKFSEEKNLDETVKKTVKQKCNNAVRRTRNMKRPVELKAHSENT